MQADPYWQSWVSSGLGDNGWTSRPDGESLVGIKYKGYGPNPAGMQTANLASQMFMIDLECLDQTNDLQKQMQRSGKIEWRAFHSTMLGKEGKQAIGHLEGSQLHVLHEKAGDYTRANANKRYILGQGTVNGCQRLSLKAEQIVYMDKPMLEQNKARKVQAMAAAGYSTDEMNAAVRAYGEQIATMDFGSVAKGYEKMMEEHERDVQQMVSSGIIKKKDDYGLLGELYSSLRAGTNEEFAGWFNFGEATIKNVQAPQGKHVLVLEFKQTCGAKDGVKTQLLGKTSPVNCSPGKRAALVLHGELGAGMLFDAHYQADRVVMYLEK